MDFLVQIGMDIFDFIMEFVQQILLVPAMEFEGGQMWVAVQSIATALLPAAEAIVIITFLISLADENLAEVNRSTMFRLGLRFSFAVVLTGAGAYFIGVIVLFGNWIIAWIITNGNPAAVNISFEIPPGVKDALTPNNVFDFAAVYSVTVVWILQLLFFLVCVGSAIMIALTVLTRIFKVFLMAALAPIPLAFSGSGAGHEFGRVTGRFILSFLGQSLQVVVIWVSLIIYSRFLSTTDMIAVSAVGNLGVAVKWMVVTILYMLVLAVVVKSSEQITSRLGFT